MFSSRIPPVLRYAPRVIRTKRAQKVSRFPGIARDVLAPLHLYAGYPEASAA
jgi:hypothetical protein